MYGYGVGTDMRKTDAIYKRLIEIALEKGKLLKEAEYDFERLEREGRYPQLEEEERKLLLQAKKIEDEEIIEHSYLFAYDRYLEKKNSKESKNEK